MTRIPKASTRVDRVPAGPAAEPAREPRVTEKKVQGPERSAKTRSKLPLPSDLSKSQVQTMVETLVDPSLAAAGVAAAPAIAPPPNGVGPATGQAVDEVSAAARGMLADLAAIDRRAYEKLQLELKGRRLVTDWHGK